MGYKMAHLTFLPGILIFKLLENLLSNFYDTMTEFYNRNIMKTVWHNAVRIYIFLNRQLPIKIQVDENYYI